MNKVVLFFLLCIGLPCYAQKPPEGAPSGNPVKFPTGPAEWTIEVTYKPLPKGSEAELNTPAGKSYLAALQKKIEVTQTGPLQRVVVTLASGKKFEYWYDTARQLLVHTDTLHGEALCVFFKDSREMAFHRTGFEPVSFEWLKKETFVDTIPYNGKQCLYYKAQVEANAQRVKEAGTNLSTKTREAWIDKETGLPIAFNDGLKTGVYTFVKDPPAVSLMMPQAFEDTIRYYMGPPRPATPGF